MTELTIFAKSGSPLTKRISLLPDGTLKSDGSACAMARGEARRVTIDSVADLGALIDRIPSNQALALRTLDSRLPDPVEATTMRKLNGPPKANAPTGEAL